MLTVRADNYLYERPDLDDTIRRLHAFADAGANVLYAPGLPSLDAIRAVCASVPKPVNVVVGLQQPLRSVDELAAAGVKRISVGSSFARVALGAFLRAAREVKEARHLHLRGRRPSPIVRPPPIWPRASGPRPSRTARRSTGCRCRITQMAGQRRLDPEDPSTAWQHSSLWRSNGSRQPPPHPEPQPISLRPRAHPSTPAPRSYTCTPSTQPASRRWPPSRARRHSRRFARCALARPSR